MIDRIDIRPNDCILLLSIPEISLVVQLADRARNGSVVGLGRDEEVHSARTGTRDLGNVMFTPASPEQIPWRDSFFTKALDLVCRWEQPERAARELFRVLAPGGKAYLADASSIRALLPAAGFSEVSSEGAFLVVERPGLPSPVS